MGKKLDKWVKEINHYGEWHSIEKELPDVNEHGDGNFCLVGVKTERGLRGQCMYGCSGFANEPYHFSQIIRTDCGDVKTSDKIVSWKYTKQEDL